MIITVSEYTISVINDGVGIESSIVDYAVHSSGVDPPGSPMTDGSGNPILSNNGLPLTDGSWSTTIPTVTGGQYLWTRTRIVRTDGTFDLSYSVSYSGEDGETGATGVSIVSDVPEWRLSDSSSTLTGTGAGYAWSAQSKPQLGDGQYIWERHRITYSDGTVKYSDAVCDITMSGVFMDVDQNKKAIAQKVWATDITNSINSYDSTTAQSIRDRVTQTETDISGIQSTVSDVQSTLTTKADGSTVTQLSQTVTQNKQAADSFQQTVETTYAKLTDVDDKIEDIKVSGRNLYLIKNEVAGYINASNGSITSPSSTYKEVTSAYIRVKPSEKYVIQSWTTPNIAGNSWLAYQFYADESGTRVGTRTDKTGSSANSGVEVTADGQEHLTYKFTVPPNANYLRISYRKFNDGYAMIEKASMPSEYAINPEDLEKYTDDQVTAVRTVAEQTADHLSWIIEENGKTASTFTFKQRSMELVNANLVIKDPAGSATIISGGKIAANSITSNILATNAIKSQNYSSGVNNSDVPSGHYSTAGTFLNLTDGAIYMPNFGVSSTGEVFMNGTVYANAGQIGDPGNAYWEIGTVYGTNWDDHAGLIAHGDALIQAGKLTMTNDRLNSQNAGSYVKIGNDWYDFGLQVPNPSATGSIDGATHKQNFLYIRKISSQPDEYTVDNDWTYLFRVDSSGDIYWNGHNISTGTYLPLSGGSITGNLSVGGTLTVTGGITGNASTATKLAASKNLNVNLATTSNEGKVAFDGSGNATLGVTGTLGVGNGGTGATSFTSGAVLIGNGTGAIQTRSIRNNTSAGALGWTASGTDNTIITTNTLAYWDGRYRTSNNDSNIEYVKLGKLGTVVTHNIDEFITTSGGTISGALSVIDLSTGDLVVTGAASFTNGLSGELTGNASSASQVNNNLKIQLNGGTTEGTNQFTYNGSAVKNINITKSSVGLGNVDNTADANKTVKEAGKVTNQLKIQLNGGTTEGTNQFTYDGSAAKTFSITKSSIGLGNVDNTADANKTVKEAGKVTNTLKIQLNGGSTEGTNQFTYDGSAQKTFSITKSSIGLSNVENTALSTWAGSSNLTTTKVGTLAGAAIKAVDTSISAGSSSANLPTSAAVAAFVEGKGYVTSSGVTSITLSAGDGISLNASTAITSTGTRTITNTGVRSIAESTENGKISVNTGGTTADVAVHGLGSWAYKSSGSASDVGLGNVTNNKQVKGLSSGTTSGHLVSWGSDGYTVADSGLTKSSLISSISINNDELTITKADGTSSTQTIIVTGQVVSGARILTDAQGTAISLGSASAPVYFTNGIPAQANTIPTITLNGTATTSPSFYAPTGAGTSGQVLKSNGSGAPSWGAVASGVKGNAETNYRTGNVNLTPANIGAVALSGSTMTGTLTIAENKYYESNSTSGINMRNSDIINVNGIYTNDAADSGAEGINFYVDATHWDSFYASNGALYFTPNREKNTNGTSYPVYFMKDYGQGTTDISIRPLVSQTRANRLAFLPGDQVIIEKTTNGGTTWVDAGYTDAQKAALFNNVNGTVSIPLLNNARSTDCGLRITITGMKYNVPSGTTETQKYSYWNSTNVASVERYFNVREWWFWVNAAGDTIRVVIERASGANPNTWTNKFNKDFGMTGWSGSDWIRAGNGDTFGGATTQTGNFWNWRLTFWSRYADGQSSFQNTTSQSIGTIYCFGDNVWTKPNNLMANDHLYSWDNNKNAGFPANVTATKFIGALQGNADSATTATTATSVATQGVGTTNVDRHVWFSDSSSETKRAHDDDFKYNPSTNTLTVANVNGNSATATKFNSTRSIALTGDVTGSVSSDGTSGWSIPTTVVDDSHNHTTNTIVPIETRTYTGLLGTSSNDAANDSFYFMKHRPDDFYCQWKLRYRVTAYIPGKTNFYTTSDVTLYGYGQNTGPAYSIFNTIYSASYRPIYYHNFYRVTQAGYNANLSNAIGVGLRASNSRDTAGYERTIKIEVLETLNCEYEFLDTPVKWANWASNSSTNYAGLSEFDGCNNGLRESGDDNDIVTQQATYTHLTAGAGGMRQYSLVMEDANGTWQSFTTTSGTGTGKTKNTTGFKLGRIYYMNMSGNIESGNANANSVVREKASAINITYSINSGSTLLANKPLWIVGTMNNGLFYLDNTWWTQTAPSTADGKVYIPLGVVYHSTVTSTAAYQIDFMGWQGAYYHDGTNFIKYEEAAVAPYHVKKAGDTMTGNLIISNTAPSLTINNTGNGESSLILQRSGSNAADWKILNTSGNLKFQNNYTSSEGAYFDVLTLNYNTGNATFKGTITGTTITGTGVNANSGNSGTAGGISLYGTAPTQYGIALRQTASATLRTHGYVQGIWAEYNCIGASSADESRIRGWIFRNFTTDENVASISGVGNAVFNGSVTVGGNTANTSGMRMEYDATLGCTNFIFN